MSDVPKIPDDFTSRFESAFARLQVAVLEACGRAGPWPAQVAAGIRAALAFAAADPPAAYALTVEALTHRPGGADRYLRLVAHFAELLSAGAPRDARRPASTEEALVGAIATIVAEQARAGDVWRLPELAPELIELTLVPYLGAEQARRVAAESGA